MAKEYVDLVSCDIGGRHPYLFIAPSFTRLKEGDEVIVDTSLGKIRAKVVAVITIQYEGSGYDFIVKATNATLPLKKVLQKVIYSDFEYDEEKENE